MIRGGFSREIGRNFSGKVVTMRNINQPEKQIPNRKRKKRTNPVLLVLRLTGLFLVLMQFAVSIFFAYQVFNTKMLPTRYGVIICVLLFVLLAVMLLLQRLKDPVKIIGAVLSVLITCGLLYASCLVGDTRGFINDITKSKTETDLVNIYVLKDDPAQSLTDAKDYLFGTLDQENDETVEKAIAAVGQQMGQEISSKSYNSPMELSQALYDGKVKAVLLSEGYANLMNSDEDPEEVRFTDRTRVLKAIHIEVQSKPERPSDENLIEGEQTIVAYVSGIDSYGSVNVKSRSDVNILLVANLKTHQVLMVNTPRDYFVPTTVSKGIPDKLTHAGLSGVECSMGTLENVYDVNIDHYLRINFTGFTNMIDILGGVEVEIPFNMHTSGAEGIYLKKGLQTLNGHQALLFARERNSFGDGDHQRGRNQMMIIEKVLKKAMSPALLANYTSILSELEANTQTNFTSAEISYLVKHQLDKMPDWNIVTTEVTGEGASRICYSIPGQYLSVCLPDEASIASAKSKIQDVLEGRIIGESEPSAENDKSQSGE